MQKELHHEMYHKIDLQSDPRKESELGFSGPASGVIWALRAQSGQKSSK